MKKLLEPFRSSFLGGNLFCFCIYSIFISFFLLHEGAKLVSFELTEVPSLFISEATVWGVDVSARVKWMYRFLFAAAALFILIFFLLKRGLKNSENKLQKHEDLLLLGISGIVLCVMRIFGTDSTHVLSSLFFLFSFKLILLILSNHKVRISPYFLNPGIFNLSISFGFLITFASVFLWGTSGLVYKNYSTIQFLTTLFFMFYYYLMLHTFKMNIRRATSYLLPLTAIPVIALLSVELSFFKGRAATYQYYFMWLLLVFTIVTFVTLFLTRKKLVSSVKQYKRAIVPALLLCLVLITSYQPIIDHNPDMFEPANILNSTQRVFEFGQLPVLDFMSSHMLSEQWYGYVYSAIFGFGNDQSSLCYGFLNSIIFVCILYHLLFQLFKRETYALAFIFFFPFVSEVFFTTALVALIPLFQVKKLIEHPSPLRLFMILFTCCALVLWRIDTGVVAVFATAIFLPLVYFLYPAKIPYKIIIKGLAYFILFVLFIFGIACVLRSPGHVANSIQHFYHYVAGSQGHGHHSLYQANVHQFYLYHIFYPLLALTMCLVSLYLLRTKYRSGIFKEGYLLMCAVFLFLLYFVHLQRGLVRHGFPENIDEYIISVFHIATALFITFLLVKDTSIQRYSVFYTSTLLIFLVVRYFPFQLSKIPLENGITEKRFYNTEKSFSDPLIEGRILMDTAFARNNYSEIKKFMDRHLNKHQTFFDFSNTSMLYYYCQRKMPSYFNQIPISNIDEFLQLKAIKDIDPEMIPVVVFSSYPKNANDAFDEIPNEMRHPIIAEFIYTHYIPLGVIDHKTLWATPKLIRKINNFLPPDPGTYQPKQYNYKFAAEYIGYYHTKKNNFDLTSIFEVEDHDIADFHKDHVFKLPSSVLKTPHCYLSLDLYGYNHPFDPYIVTVDLLDNTSQTVGRFTFERRNNNVSDTYMLRLSNHYLWHIKKISAIKVTYPSDHVITNFKLLKDTRPEYKTPNIN